MNNGEYTLKRNGSVIHYWLSGREDAPLVVFTHGATLDHQSFDLQVELLEHHYRILTWDVRGHGVSQPIGNLFSIRNSAEDLLAIIDDVGAQKAVFVGLSMGGNITQELVFYHPERVAALVLMDCACNTMVLSRWERFWLRMSVPMLRMYPPKLLRQQIANQSSIKSEVRVYIRQACQKVISGEDFMTIWAEVTNCIHEEPNYSIRQPLLLMRGDQDKLGNFKTAMPRWAKRDHAEYHIVPNAGHTANQDNPAFVNQRLIEFLERDLRGDSR